MLSDSQAGDTSPSHLALIRLIKVHDVGRPTAIRTRPSRALGGLSGEPVTGDDAETECDV